MQYQGGKHIAAKHIVAAMQEYGATPEQPVIEPFCGGCSVTVALCRAGFHVWASDINPSLILLWQKALLQDLEPFELDAESYQRWKTAPNSAEKALVGYGASFGGKWFRGMAESATKTPTDYLVGTIKTVNKQAQYLRGYAQFECRNYLSLPPTEDAVYYLDKPYTATERHYGESQTSHDRFDHRLFWDWARDRAKRNQVFVSEYEAPWGHVVMEKETPLGLAAGRNGSGRKQVERLFLL